MGTDTMEWVTGAPIISETYKEDNKEGIFKEWWRIWWFSHVQYIFVIFICQDQVQDFIASYVFVCNDDGVVLPTNQPYLSN